MAAGNLDLVRAAPKACLDFCAASGLQPLANQGRDFRARFLDQVGFETPRHLGKEKGEQSFDTVRAFFVEGELLYENAGLRSLDHIQICVRNPRKIVGCVLPRT